MTSGVVFIALTSVLAGLAIVFAIWREIVR